MKKIYCLFVCTCFCISGAQAAEFSEQISAFESAFHRQSVSTVLQSRTIPPTQLDTVEKQILFKKYLKAAEEIYNQSSLVQYFETNYPSEWNLVHKGMIYMSKEEYFVKFLEHMLKQAGDYPDDEILPEDHERAIKYAIFVLMIESDSRYEKYRSHLGYTKEWLQQHPVQDWASYVELCKFYMDLFYFSIKEFVQQYHSDIDIWRVSFETRDWLPLEMQY